MISERSFAHSFDSFWSELLPLLTPRYITLFNEAYERRLTDSSGTLIEPLPVGSEVEKVDIVAEFSFRLAKNASRNNMAFDAVSSEQHLLDQSERQAFELIEKYEGARPEASSLNLAEVSEGINLCSRYQSVARYFGHERGLEFCPKFPGAGFIASCEGDISAGGCLIEVKTTTRKISAKVLKQLITYAALDSVREFGRWSSLAIFNPRRGLLHEVEMDSLILAISGGKSKADVFAELISFAESQGEIAKSRF